MRDYISKDQYIEYELDEDGSLIIDGTRIDKSDYAGCFNDRINGCPKKFMRLRYYLKVAYRYIRYFPHYKSWNVSEKQNKFSIFPEVKL